MDADSKLVRADVAKILGTLAVAEATNELVAMLADEAKEVRDIASAELAKPERLVTDEQTTTIIGMVLSTDLDVSLRAAKLLGQLNTPMAISTLVGLTKPEVSDALQMVAAEGLSGVVSSDATMALIGLLRDSEPTVRERALAGMTNRLLNEQELVALSEGLASQDTAIVVLTVDVMRKSASVVAVNLLTARLQVELNDEMKVLLQDAIAEVGARISPIEVEGLN